MTEQQEKAIALPSPTAAILVIGNEILSGRTLDTNSNYLAENLSNLGIMVREMRTVPDREHKIVSALNALRMEYSYVFTTGGIGPTHDDITAQSVAKAFDVELDINEDARAMLVNHYGGEDALTEGRLRMARIPRGANLISNPVSGAPGFQIGNVYVMAGVPYIMQAMFDLISTNLQRGKRLLVNTISCNLGESVLALEMEQLQGQYSDVDIGSYPSFKGGSAAGLSLVLRGANEARVAEATKALLDLIAAKGGQGVPVSLDADI